jgi:CheY-like chemotaxis protein
MKFIAIEIQNRAGGGTEVYIPKPLSYTLISIGSGGADVPLADAGKSLATISPSDEGLTVEARSGDVEVNGKALAKPKTIRPGDTLSLGGHRFQFKGGDGWILREISRDAAAEQVDDSAFESGFEVFRVPFGMDVQSHPLKPLNAIKEQLQLAGVKLLHNLPGKTEPEDYLAGQPFPMDISKALGAVKNEMLFLSSSPAESVMAVGYNWPDGGHSTLIGWTDRMASIGYLTNLYHHLPEVLSALLVLQKTEALVDEAIEGRFASMGMLAVGMTHIFNNLFGAIYGYAQLAKSRPEFVQKLVSSSVDSTARAQGVLNIMTNLSPHQGRSRKRMSILSAVRDIVTLVEAEAARRGVSIKITPPSNEMAIFAPPSDVYQMLLAFMLNGMANTPEGESLTIEFARDGTAAEVCITDLGIDTDTHERALLWQPFARRYTPSEIGEPLHILLARRLVSTLGGEVREKQVNKGMEFRIRLPLVQDEAVADLPKQQTETNSQRQASVLVVDDEQDYQMLVAQALKPLAVECATRAAEAIELLKKNTYKAVVLDLLLSNGSSGDEVYNYLIENAPETRVVIVTGVTLKEADRKRFGKAAAILAKPFDFETLRAALRP